MTDYGFSVAARPRDRRFGMYRELVGAARPLIGSDQCVQFAINGRSESSVRATAYTAGARYLEPGERIHVSIKDGVLSFWLTKESA